MANSAEDDARSEALIVHLIAEDFREYTYRQRLPIGSSIEDYEDPLSSYESGLLEGTTGEDGTGWPDDAADANGSGYAGPSTEQTSDEPEFGGLDGWDSGTADIEDTQPVAADNSGLVELDGVTYNLPAGAVTERRVASGPTLGEAVRRINRPRTVSQTTVPTTRMWMAGPYIPSIGPTGYWARTYPAASVSSTDSDLESGGENRLAHYSSPAIDDENGADISHSEHDQHCTKKSTDLREVYSSGEEEGDQEEEEDSKGKEEEKEEDEEEENEGGEEEEEDDDEEDEEEDDEGKEEEDENHDNASEDDDHRSSNDPTPNAKGKQRASDNQDSDSDSDSNNRHPPEPSTNPTTNPTIIPTDVLALMYKFSNESDYALPSPSFRNVLSRSRRASPPKSRTKACQCGSCEADSVYKDEFGNEIPLIWIPWPGCERDEIKERAEDNEIVEIRIGEDETLESILRDIAMRDERRVEGGERMVAC